MKLKDTCSLEESCDKPRQYIKKQRHYFANKGPSSQSYGFSSGHLWLWELDYKESWVSTWCFWTVVLERTLESPLDCKEIQPVNPKGIQSWLLIGRCWCWNSNSLFKLISIESVMPSNRLIFCHPLLFLPSIFASIRAFSNGSVLRIRWSKYWSFSFSISPSNEY